MLVDHERRFVFLHIPKCAGQAIVRALGYEHESGHHDLDGVGMYRDYLRFCFVRHPLDRFISSYRYSVDMATQGKINKHPIRSFIVERELTSSVQEFVEAVAADASIKLFANLHFRPQIRWIERGRPQFIGRAETLELDLDRVASLIGIPPIESLRRANVSRAEVEVDLDDRARHTIQEWYEEDFRYLGYSRRWRPSS